LTPGALRTDDDFINIGHGETNSPRSISRRQLLSKASSGGEADGLLNAKLQTFYLG
jgi:hypothetical protein